LLLETLLTGIETMPALEKAEIIKIENWLN
jgi:hypothetical protein